MFTPYRPSDYRGLIDEFLAAESARAKKIGAEAQAAAKSSISGCSSENSSEEVVSDKSTVREHALTKGRETPRTWMGGFRLRLPLMSEWLLV